jgi:hypothetical protein
MLEDKKIGWRLFFSELAQELQPTTSMPLHVFIHFYLTPRSAINKESVLPKF